LAVSYDDISSSICCSAKKGEVIVTGTATRLLLRPPPLRVERGLPPLLSLEGRWKMDDPMGEKSLMAGSWKRLDGGGVDGRGGRGSGSETLLMCPSGGAPAPPSTAGLWK
jgi:hypothetical protein